MYLDPTSWSLAFQVLIGAILAIPVLIGVYWGRIKAYFTKKRGEVSKE